MLRVAVLLAVLGLGLAEGLAWGEERLELEGMAVIGNRELPKALFIVPWKQPEPGELVGRPVQGLLDEALEPVDRDELRRELEYYGLVHSAP